MIKDYQIIEPDTEGYYNLKIAVSIFEKYTHMLYSIRETWKDLDANIRWTSIIQDISLMQCLVPDDWFSVVNANNAGEIENIVIEIINELPMLYGLKNKILGD